MSSQKKHDIVAKGVQYAASIDAEAQAATELPTIETIRIRNVLAIEEAVINVGSGLKISGRTGSGKTSILDALSAVFDENVRTRMVRQGEKDGEIMLIMSDGTSATRKVNDEKAERPVVLGPNGKAVGSPATYLKKLAPALLLNPVRFVHMDESQKAKVLAQVFPVELPQAEIEAICGEDVDLQGLDPNANGLERANQAYKAAYAARHGANGELKQAESSRDTERKKIPENFDVESVRNLSSETIAQDLAKIEHHNRLVSDGTTQLTKLQGEEATLNSEIENLKKQLAEKEGKLKEVSSRISAGREWLAKNQWIDPAPTQATLHTLDQQRMYLHCYDQAEAYDKQCKDIASRALRLDAIVATLKTLPGELVRRAKIPIEGLTLENGVVHVNGLPINNLSDGEQYRIAVKVAAAGAKELKFICIDGAEAISDAVRDKLIDDLKAEGFKVFYTVADECDFDVRDLEGNPADARIKIAPKGETRVIAAPVAKPTDRVLTAPKALANKIALTADAVLEPARQPEPVAKPRQSLFDATPEDEALFGEPSI